MAEITNSQEFMEALLAAEERLGIPHGIMKVRGKMDSSDTIRYDVVTVSRRPQTEDEPPRDSQKEIIYGQ